MGDPITFTSSQAVTIKGRDGAQLANDDEVYTWDADAAAYGPCETLERLVTHDTSGAGSYEMVFQNDGSLVWH